MEGAGAPQGEAGVGGSEDARRPPRLPPAVTPAVADAGPPGRAPPSRGRAPAPRRPRQSGRRAPALEARGAAGPKRAASSAGRAGGTTGRGTEEAPREKAALRPWPARPPLSSTYRAPAARLSPTRRRARPLSRAPDRDSHWPRPPARRRAGEGRSGRKPRLTRLAAASLLSPPLPGAGPALPSRPQRGEQWPARTPRRGRGQSRDPRGDAGALPGRGAPRVAGGGGLTTREKEGGGRARQGLKGTVCSWAGPGPTAGCALGFPASAWKRGGSARGSAWWARFSLPALPRGPSGRVLGGRASRPRGGAPAGSALPGPWAARGGLPGGPSRKTRPGFRVPAARRPHVPGPGRARAGRRSSRGRAMPPAWRLRRARRPPWPGPREAPRARGARTTGELLGRVRGPGSGQKADGAAGQPAQRLRGGGA